MYSEKIYTRACAKGIETSLLSLMYFLQFHNFLTTVKSLLVPASTIFSGHFFGQFYLVKFGYYSRVGYYSRAGTNRDITVCFVLHLIKYPCTYITYVLEMPEDAFSKMNEYHTLNFVMSVVMLEHTLCFQRQIDFTPKKIELL